MRMMMSEPTHTWMPWTRRLAMAVITSLLAACGGGGHSPAVQAGPQTIQASVSADLAVGASVSVTASASSGLALQYLTSTPTVCAVNDAGQVTGLQNGTCVITVMQGGDAEHAAAKAVSLQLKVLNPNQTLSFAAAPTLSLGGTTTVHASASSGLAVQYSSLTPSVCTVDATGLVSDLTAGDCTIAANQGGNAQVAAAPQVTQTLTVASCAPSLPGAPAGLAVRLDASGTAVVLTATAIDAGCSTPTGYTVRSTPAQVNATVQALPATVPCGGPCSGLAFTLATRNAQGEGAASSLTPVITALRVTTVWHEPDTQPNDSIFLGTFTYNSTTRTVTGLQGRLSESMTGGSTAYPHDTMTWLSLTHPLISWHDDTLGGTLVASFRNADTATFFVATGSTDNWSPQAGVDVGGIHHGYPSATTGVANPGNAYALIFVPDEPLAALTGAQLKQTAYADCAPGGMMGAVCMTGTASAGYGSVGTMGGVPDSQQIAVVLP